LALAELLKGQGEEIQFVCRNEAGHISAQIESQGYKVHLLDSNHTTGDVEYIKARAPKDSWLIIDHYGIDQKLEAQLQDHFRIFVIDDLANRRHNCEFLLDANVVGGQPSYQGWIPLNAVQFLGPQYALLRTEFREARKKIPPYSKRSGRVLIFFGGSDESGETLRFLKALNECSTNLQFDILVSKHHRHLQEILKQSLGSKAQLHVSPEKVSELMLGCSLYFGSGGTVTWERMAMGLPGIVTSVADNQIEIAKNLGHENQQIYEGPCNQLDYHRVIQKVENVLKDSDWCERTSEKNQRLVRPLPLSVIRSVFGSQKSGFQLRLVTLRDARFVFEMRNDPVTRKMSIQSGELKWEEHWDWFQKALGILNQRIYIGELDGKPCGQFRVNANLETSVMIASEFRGKSLATRLIEEGSRLYQEEFQAMAPKLKAFIKPENIASRKAFERAGYRLQVQPPQNGSELNLFLLDMSIDTF
jgi:UDP-2,4-diacetamido-2,4,6-trideoxy-beta-L-altropyranose hydrolase